MEIETSSIVTLDPDIKAEWIADLRSGNYSQTKGYLANSEGHCCLGVLSEQAVRKSVAEKFPAGDTMEFRSPGSLSGSRSCLTDGIARWAGMTYSDSVTAYGLFPFRDRDDCRVYLDTLNDEGMSFNQIADLIDYWY